MTTKKKIIIGSAALSVTAIAAYLLTRKNYEKLLFERAWSDRGKPIPQDLLNSVIVSVDKKGVIQHKDGTIGQFKDNDTIVWNDGVSIWKVSGLSGIGQVAQPSSLLLR